MVDLLIVVSLASWRMEIPGTMGHGTGDGSLSHILLAPVQAIRPVFDIIIIENRASIKSAIHQVRSFFSLTCQLR